MVRYVKLVEVTRFKYDGYFNKRRSYDNGSGFVVSLSHFELGS